MRLLIAALLTTATFAAHAATQQQCEALIKPIEAKMAGLQRTNDSKPTPESCARAKEVIGLYVDYKVKADKLDCPFAFVSGQKIGGAEERADLISDLKKAYAEKCR